MARLITALSWENMRIVTTGEGSYGDRLESGEQIGSKRVLADPIATLSVEAQELLEKLSHNHLAA